MTLDTRLAASQYARCMLLHGITVHYWRHAYAVSGPKGPERSVVRATCLPASATAVPNRPTKL